MNGRCERCGSYAINHHSHGRDGSDAELCDVCYWRKRAESLENGGAANGYRDELARVTADLCALQAKADHWRETSLIAEGENARLRGELAEQIAANDRLLRENKHLTGARDVLRGELEALRLGPIERSDGLVRCRYYIPLPGGWEMQTKGTGSTFRIVDTKSGDRLAVPDSPHLHETLERMAREIHSALVRIDGEKA